MIAANNKGENGTFIKRKRAAGRILQLLLTNPLNSQLDTNVALPTVGKKWISPVGQSLL